jgi:hypothetical protein
VVGGADFGLSDGGPLPCGSYDAWITPLAAGTYRLPPPIAERHAARGRPSLDDDA